MIFLLVTSIPESIVNFRRPLIEALQNRGVAVHVAAPDLPADSAIHQELAARGVVVHDVPMRRTGLNPAADLGTALFLWKRIRSIRPDVLLASAVKPVVYGTLAAALVGVPRRFALITGLGYVFQGGGQRTFLRSLVASLYALALRRAHKVFFQNPDDEALFRSLGIIGRNTPSVVVNGSGVCLSEFKPVPVPEGEQRFLMIARLLGDKGVREYAEAARRIRAQRPDVVFSLVGWIDQNPDSIRQEELDAWVREGAVDYLGRLKDVRPAIAACTVQVLPSYGEGTPHSVLEAMAMGRAIITTDTSGCRETVVNGDNGFLVAVRSVDHLVEAMQRFVEEPTLAKRMGARSLQVAKDKYDVRKVNATMLKEMCI